MTMEFKPTGDPDLDNNLRLWMEWDKNEKTKAELLELYKENKVEDLHHRLCSRMAFGTAGLRARMGAGNSMMNDLTIIQATQGLVKYILNVNPKIKEEGIVVGHDARYNSERFAALTASIILSQNIPVYLFSKIVPTPFVPYAVTKYGCGAGIMVTASHNPKEDNGYKVYWGNGSQIIPPIDKGIHAFILEYLEPWPTSWNTDIIRNSPLRKDPYEEVYKGYMVDVISLSCYHSENSDTSLKFTYSAMHGVGCIFVEEAFKSFNLKPMIKVKEQVEPDPDFPTVKFPNPEEGKSALDLSMSTADAAGSTLILANDPDADRLAVAEKQSSGEWYIFSGNELGALLGWWSWHCYKTKNPDADGSKVYMLASTVSSKILRTIGNKDGFKFEETLTGFKWMGNKSSELIKAGNVVLFAYEEAIGFMCGTTVLDKDGVSASVVAAEMAIYLNKQGLSIKDQLEKIYDNYGYHLAKNSYFISHDHTATDAMFSRLRNYDGPNTYPKSCGNHAIKYIRDLTTGYDNQQPDNKAVLPVSKSSHMITFTFENGVIATLRTSGTEPKIKYYTEIIAEPDAFSDRAAVESLLEDVIQNIVEHFYQPEKNKFLPRPT